MKEHFTEAFILDIQEKGEFDSLITLYTRDFGKITAKAKSIKKIIFFKKNHCFICQKGALKAPKDELILIINGY